MVNKPSRFFFRTAEVAGQLNRTDSASFKRRVFRAGSWTLLGHFASLALRLVASIILTRIFSPDVFGLFAIVTMVTAVITVLTDIGLRQAVVQSPHGNSAVFVSTAWSVQVVRGVSIWVLCATVAGGLVMASSAGLVPPRSVYADPILPELIIVASLSSIILGFQSMKACIVTRELSLGRLIAIDLFSQILGLMTVIVFGLITKSIWSYVFGLLIAGTVSVILSHTWLEGPRTRFAWDRDALSELRHFGRWIFLSSAVSATILNGDRMFLAALVSPSELGLYSIANNLVSVADALANKIYGTVVMPALSEMNRSRPDRVSRLFSRMRWASDSLMLIAAGFLFSAGPTIVHVLYDQRYAQAGWMLSFVSFSLVFARYNIVGSAYLGLGRPKYLAAINVFRSFSLFLFLGVGFLVFGLPGAIIGVGLHMMPATLAMLYLNQRLRINDFRLELFVLPMWVVGCLAGFGVSSLFGLAAA